MDKGLIAIIMVFVFVVETLLLVLGLYHYRGDNNKAAKYFFWFIFLSTARRAAENFVFK